MGNIKYCAWDIGKVIYDYSLKPLEKWCERHTCNKALYATKKGSIDYDDYMRGHMRFEEFCRYICDYYLIAYRKEYIREIEDAFWDGVGKDYDSTKRVMKRLKKKGIENAIISNALPILIGSGNFQTLVKPQNRFYSFDVGLLKPEADMYEFVRKSLGIEFEELIFVDNKTENIEAAKKLGINAILFYPDTIEADIKKFIK